jgi:hypothetical protein
MEKLQKMFLCRDSQLKFSTELIPKQPLREIPKHLEHQLHRYCLLVQEVPLDQHFQMHPLHLFHPLRR